MEAYLRSDPRLHLLCQPLAKANRSYVPRQPDDSHTNLSFDALGRRIAGRWIQAPGGPCLLSLSLDSFCFEWLDAAFGVLQSHPAAGKTLDEAEAAIESGLAALGLGPAGFRQPLHFEISPYPFAKEILQLPDPQETEAWMHWRRLAFGACAQVQNHLQWAGEARIWPHHFDTGIYGEAAGRIGLGFGFAMADSLSPSPYFYLAGYPLRGALRFEGLPALGAGRWETGSGWKGALLPAAALESLPPEQQQEAVEIFARQALGWFLRAA